MCEAFADGEADERALRVACDGAKFESGPPRPGPLSAVCQAAANATHWICYSAYKVGRATEAAPSVHGYEAAIAAGLLADAASPEEAASMGQAPVFREGIAMGERIQADVLREVIGHPFRPAAFDAAWRTPAVAELARAAYEQRALPAGTLEADRLAVLADALEEAGCTDEAILGHLRGPGPHVRGCFALDLVLGKE